jgi:enoyl-CoA hydratase
VNNLCVSAVDSISIIRFNRPKERNPLSAETLSELEDAIHHLSAKSAIVFTGSDDVFLSGANIRELTQLNQSTAVEFSRRGQRIMQKIADSSATTIAAINGYCMGGGLDLALACDIRIATPQAIFAHPGARLGIITGWGGTQRLPRLIGKSNAIEMFATARRVDSSEALRIGLITKVCEDVVTEAIALAHQEGTGFHDSQD